MSEVLLRGTFATDAGSIVLWNRDAFAMVCDYDTWCRELDVDQMLYHFDAGNYVPLWSDGDGSFGCEIRLGTIGLPASLTPREIAYIDAVSEPYLLRGGEVCLGGIEHIHADPCDWAVRFQLPNGRYGAVVYLLRWTDEPGAVDAGGKVASDALPDLLILLNPADWFTVPFRRKAEPFDHLWDID